MSWGGCTPEGEPGGGLPAGVDPGDILEWDGAEWVPNAEGPPPLGASLVWDGATWIPTVILPDGSFPFMVQADWFVDSVNGDDTNDGDTALTALKTLAELTRRFEGKVSKLTHTITLAGTFPTEVLALRFIAFGNVTISGTPTLSTNGITTAFTALAAPATRAVLADTTTPIVWAARVGQRVRLTSGANSGAIAWVLSDGGANTARVSQFTSLITFLGVAPAVNDTFAIETLATVLGGIQIECLGTGLVTIQDMAIALTGGTSVRAYAAGGTNNGVTIRKCVFQTNAFSLGMGSACNIVACSNATTSGVFLGRDSTCVVAGHAAFADLTCSVSPYVLFAAAASCWQTCRFLVAGGTVDVATTLAIFDLAGANPCVSVDVGACINATATIMGINNTTTGQGIRVRSNGGYVYSTAGTAPTVTGAGGDTSIGGTVTTYAAIAAAPQSAIMNANNGAMIGLRS